MIHPYSATKILKNDILEFSDGTKAKVQEVTPKHIQVKLIDNKLSIVRFRLVDGEWGAGSDTFGDLISVTDYASGKVVYTKAKNYFAPTGVTKQIRIDPAALRAEKFLADKKSSRAWNSPAGTNKLDLPAVKAVTEEKAYRNYMTLAELKIGVNLLTTENLMVKVVNITDNEIICRDPSGKVIGSSHDFAFNKANGKFSNPSSAFSEHIGNLKLTLSERVKPKPYSGINLNIGNILHTSTGMIIAVTKLDRLSVSGIVIHDPKNIYNKKNITVSFLRMTGIPSLIADHAVDRPHLWGYTIKYDYNRNDLGTLVNMQERAVYHYTLAPNQYVKNSNEPTVRISTKAIYDGQIVFFGLNNKARVCNALFWKDHDFY